MHLLTLGNLLEIKAAQIKGEALGRIRVATAGIKNNCFHSVMRSSFSYDTSSAAPDTTADEESDRGPSTAPPPGTRPRGVFPHRPSAPGSRSESESSHVSPKTTGATPFKPGREPKAWSRTGLASDFVPKKVEDDEKYHCSFPLCQVPPKQKLDTMATHIRRDHLNICLACHYCDTLFWSSVSWTKHCGNVHKGLPYVPEDAEDPGVFSGDFKFSDSDIVEINQEEAAAVKAALGLEDMDVEPEVSIVDELVE